MEHGFHIQTPLLMVPLFTGEKIMQSNGQNARWRNIDQRVFWPATVLTLAMAILFTFDPETSNKLLDSIHAFTTRELGWFFLLATFAAVVTCISLSLSRFGGIVLGVKGEKPEFSTLTWLGMIFTSGTGGSILYLSSVEWIWIMQSPPFGLEAGSPAAARWASAYGMFHWGPSAWAWYLLVAVTVGYFYYIRRETTLKISEFARPLLGDKVDGFAGNLIGFLYMFGLLGGVMTSLALGTPLISNILVHVVGLDKTNAFVDTFVIFLWTFIPLITLLFGLKKGLSKLSNWNIRLDIAMLVGIAVCGPLSFILNQSVDGIGMMLQNFIYMSLATDVVGKSGFHQDWTVFYFSWWVVYAMPYGIFIAKISKGRTIRELIVGGLTAGSLGCMVFYMVLANYGMDLQLRGVVDVVSLLSEQGRGAVVLRILETLPMPVVFIALFGSIVLISYITGHCAVGYSLAAATQKETCQGEDPAHWNIAFWLILAGGVSLALYFINPQSLKPLQTMSILTGFPICFVVYILVHSLFKQLSTDFPDGLPDADRHGRIYLEVASRAEVAASAEIAAAKTAKETA